MTRAMLGLSGLHQYLDIYKRREVNQRHFFLNMKRKINAVKPDCVATRMPHVYVSHRMIPREKKNKTPNAEAPL